MSSHHDDTRPGHPAMSLVRSARRGFADAAGAALWSLDAAQTRDLAVETAALAAQVAELEARVVAHADTLDLAVAEGMRSTAAWLSHHTRLTGREAQRRTRLASDLAAHEQTRTALAGGDVHVEQAVVITAAADELPQERERAEKHLLGEAAAYDATDLRTLGRRILEHLDPDRADEHEAALLEKQEARAAKKTRFTMSDDGEGLTHGRFSIPSAQASMVLKMLTAIAAPKHVRAVHGAGSYEHGRPTPERLGQAFVELIERFPADLLPRLGALNATVVATVQHEVLLGAAKAAHLDTGVTISPSQLRRWACEAGILPAVMDGAGHVLDLGRKRRFHSTAQRLAAVVEQQHCQAAACRTPAAYCHVHHRIPWSEGGGTSTRDAVLLCPFHHHRAHTEHITYPMRC